MTAPKKPLTAKQQESAVKKATKQKYGARQNSFSVASQALPKPTNMVKKPEVTAEEKAVTRSAGQRRKGWAATPEGQARTAEGVGHVERLTAPSKAATVLPAGSSRYGAARARTTPAADPAPRSFSAPRDEPRGEATTLSAVMGHSAAYGLMHRGTHVSDEQHRAGLEQFLGPAVPDLNSPHHVPETVVPQRRWEDLHPHEQAKALAAAAKHGVTMASAKRDYGSQLDQAHNRAFGEGQASTYSSLFYSGPSEPHDRIDLSAGRNAQHPNAQPMKVSMRDVQSIANSITSPRNKFSLRKKGHSETLFPNDEHANTAIQHVLNNPHMSAEEAAATVPNNTGPSGGGIHGNIKRAAYAAHQLIYGGATPRTLMNPPGEKGNRSRVFGTASTEKTTAYASAWMQPDSPDAFLTTDVHTGHGFAAHLGTAKKLTKVIDPETGKRKLGKSEVETYIAETPHVHALHDYIARQVHAERGLSPSVNNARFIHRGQAAQWGEERVQRPDINETHETAYPKPTRAQQIGRALPAQDDEADRTWGMGDQKRHENTVAKRRRQGPRLSERTAGLDPNARTDGWT